MAEHGLPLGRQQLKAQKEIQNICWISRLCQSRGGFQRRPGVEGAFLPAVQL